MYFLPDRILIVHNPTYKDWGSTANQSGEVKDVENITTII